MGELLGIPEWLAMTLWVIVFGGVIWFWAWRNTRKMISATLAKRPNPTKEDFLAILRADVALETAEFLWERAIVQLEPRLTPHPDDHMIDDLPLDEDEWSMDWPREFAEKQGFHESNLPDWPADWPVTVRNFGRWLDLGPQQTV